MTLRRLAVHVVFVFAVATSATVSASDAQLRLRVPHDDPSVGIADDFGMWVHGRIHQGVDLLSPRGTPVLAAADGVISTLTHDERPGWYVTIDHLDGWRTLYLHLDGREPLWPSDRRGAETAFAEGLEVGMTVEAGDVIGFVGSSGNAQRHIPHTHFELRDNGTPVDPYPYIMAAIRAWHIEDAILRGESPYR